MGDETSKAVRRRQRDPVWAERIFVGRGIDVGAGGDPIGKFRESHYPGITECRAWDVQDGDGQVLAGVGDNSLDWLHSSHCLEHLRDPEIALSNWLRVVRPGGFVVVIVPDEDLYEQGSWPSSFNGDHKHTFTVQKTRSWSPVSVNVLDLCRQVAGQAELVRLERLLWTFDERGPRRDQTVEGADSAIEFVLRKR